MKRIRYLLTCDTCPFEGSAVYADEGQEPPAAVQMHKCKTTGNWKQLRYRK